MSTADFDDSYEYSESSSDNCWGRLLPIGMFFRPIELIKERYTFGRWIDCDYVFDDPELRKQQYFLAYSKIHFALSREATANGTFTFLEDYSTHGTYINGVKVGKEKKHMLKNDDEIALLSPEKKSFLYIDQSESDDGSYPQEIMRKYIVSRLLGKGSYGEVRLAFERSTSASFAIKTLAKSTGHMEPNQLMNEVNLMMLLEHPCIVKIKEVIDSDMYLYIVLELVSGGDLFDYIVKNDHLSESMTKLIFYQIVKAVKYLHDQGVTHRDLKPENILLANNSDNNGDEEFLIKITDFGVSKLVDENTSLKTMIGTPSYCAPEIFTLCDKNSGSYTNAVDCWSLGIILYACLIGELPFTNKNNELLISRIINGKFTIPDKSAKYISHDAVDMIQKFLTVDPNKRMTLQEALTHPWLQDKKMIEKALCLMSSCKSSFQNKQEAKKRPSEDGLNTEEPNAKMRQVESSIDTTNITSC